MVFVARCADPVIQSDAWYFLDVFISKAINGTLRFSDFFIKRNGFDHAQPLFKLLNLIELKFFHLNFAVGAFVGAIATGAMCVIFYRYIVSSRGTETVRQYLAWVAVSVLLMSLNAHGMVWTVPLNAVENITSLIALVFFICAWRAVVRRRYVGLIIVTLVLAITSDDSAILAVAAVVLALITVALTDRASRSTSMFYVLGVIVALTVLVRIGYSFAPIVGGTAVPVGHRLDLLLKSFEEGGWWQWSLLPMSLPVAYHPIDSSINAEQWTIVLVVVGVLVLIAHVLFWVRVLRGDHNRSTFVSVCLMFLSYGWLAGIIVSRIPVFGNTFIFQPRYVLLFSTQIVALIVMWGSSGAVRRNLEVVRTRSEHLLPTLGCVVLLLVQVPNSVESWRLEPYLHAYYTQTAVQINELVLHPEHPPADCQPWIHVCKWPLVKRVELPRILRDNHLNIYSEKLQRMYRYLPEFAMEPSSRP